MGQKLSACDSRGFGSSPEAAISALNSNLMFKFGAKMKTAKSGKLYVKLSNKKKLYAMLAKNNDYYMAFLDEAPTDIDE